MPPNLPIIEKIAVNIESVINTIDAGASYNYTLTAIRPKRRIKVDDAWKDLDALIVQSDENGRPKSQGAFGIVSPRQLFDIYTITVESDTASTSIDTKNNKIGSDIVTALRLDPQRGGNAIQTDILIVEPFLREGFSGIFVRAEVWYNIKEDDPTIKS